MIYIEIGTERYEVVDKAIDAIESLKRANSIRIVTPGSDVRLLVEKNEVRGVFDTFFDRHSVHQQSLYDRFLRQIEEHEDWLRRPGSPCQLILPRYLDRPFLGDMGALMDSREEIDRAMGLVLAPVEERYKGIFANERERLSPMWDASKIHLPGERAEVRMRRTRERDRRRQRRLDEDRRLFRGRIDALKLEFGTRGFAQLLSAYR